MGPGGSLLQAGEGSDDLKSFRVNLIIGRSLILEKKEEAQRAEGFMAMIEHLTYF